MAKLLGNGNLTVHSRRPNPIMTPSPSVLGPWALGLGPWLSCPPCDTPREGLRTEGVWRNGSTFRQWVDQVDRLPKVGQLGTTKVDLRRVTRAAWFSLRRLDGRTASDDNSSYTSGETAESPPRAARELVCPPALVHCTTAPFLRLQGLCREMFTSRVPVLICGSCHRDAFGLRLSYGC
jgi:hypothetical protein